MNFFTSALLVLTAIPRNVFSFRITGPTAGIDPMSGERPARQDLRTLETSGPAWDLYIQALQRFQTTDQGELLSWYEVAGIHGRPYREWDGVQGPNQMGYCTHGSVIFPTWHRPYIALFEQVLWNHTQSIAGDYPDEDRDDYLAAADSFRMPYWDWASDAAMPASLTSAQITITTPEGEDTVDNPLFRYNFQPPPGPPDFPRGSRFEGAPFTTRSDGAQGSLESNAGSLRDRTYNLLTRQPEYTPFSNNAFSDDSGNAFDSIESIHDSVHGLIGGWMGIVPYSSFDPIFLLHHTNVDRLFAIWQALYPDSYVTSQPTNLGTFTTDPGVVEDVNTALTPFHSDDGDALYTSVGVRSTRAFGYTYPEVRDWEGSAEEVASNVRDAVERLYNGETGLAPRGNSPTTFSLRRRQGSSSNGGAYAVPPALRDDDDLSYREWYANVRINKFVITESFYVHFFIGDVPSDPSTWLAGPESFVGTFVVFTDPSMANGVTEVTIRGQIPLTRRLVELFDQGVIPDVNIDTMSGFLRTNLRWRAQRYDRSEISLGDLDSLRIFVVSNIIGGSGGDCDDDDDGDVDAGTGNTFVGDLEAIPDITLGRDGGVSGPDECK